VLPAAIVTTVFGVGIYTYFYTLIEKGLNTTVIPTDALAKWQAYNVDAGFGAAAATIVAQPALSTFVSFAAFGLILFLEPPLRFFTSWTSQSPDKRPALLALALAVIYVIVRSGRPRQTTLG